MKDILLGKSGFACSKSCESLVFLGSHVIGIKITKSLEYRILQSIATPTQVIGL